MPIMRNSKGFLGGHKKKGDENMRQKLNKKQKTTIHREEDRFTAEAFHFGRAWALFGGV